MMSTTPQYHNYDSASVHKLTVDAVLKPSLIANSPTPSSASRTPTLPISDQHHRTHHPRQPRASRLPIACRFVATDQWFTTHVDPTWTVRYTKIFLLSRCDNPASSFPQPSRPNYASSAWGFERSTQPALTPLSIPPSTGPHSSSPPSSAGGASTSSSSAASGTASSPSSAEIIFSRNSDESDQDEDDDDELSDIAPPRRNLHPSRLPRRTKSGTMSLSGIDPHLLSSGTRTATPTSSFPSSPSLPTHQSPSPGPLFAFYAVSLDSVAKSAADAEEQLRTEQYVKRRGAELKADDFVLCSFSTGQTLEDHMTLSFYRFRPSEMIEIQRKHRRVCLSRTAYEAAYLDTLALVHASKEKESRSEITVPSRSLPTPVEGPKHNDREWDSKRPTAPLNTPSGSSPSISPSAPNSPATEHRRPPYRSHSSHFKPPVPNSRTGTTYEINQQDERDRWKGKDRERGVSTDAMMDLLGPPAVMDMGQSLPGIGVSTRTGDKEMHASKKAQKKAEKEAREVMESVMKPENWKARCLVINEGSMYVWKDKYAEAPSAIEYDLGGILSIEEAAVPPESGANHAEIANPLSVVARFRMYEKDIHSSSRPREFSPICVVLRIRALDSETHEHLLRVLYRALVASQASELSTHTPVSPHNRPPPSSFPARAMSPPLPGRSPSPVLQQQPRHHRNSLSMSSDAQSQSSHADSEHGGRSNRSIGRLPSLRKKRSYDKRKRTESETWDGDTESIDSAIVRPPSSTPSSSPQHNRRLSLGAAVRMGPPPVAVPTYVAWREKVMKRCVMAGKGDPQLRGHGRYQAAWSPWQIHAAGGLVDETSDQENDVFTSRRRMTVKPSTKNGWGGDEANEDERDDGVVKSEFEWDSWKSDSGYIVSPGTLTAAETSAFGPPLSPLTPGLASYSFFGDLGVRRGSVPTIGVGPVGPSAVHHSASLHKRVVGKAAGLPGATATAVGSFADAVIGRARSKSVITITPQQQHQQLRSPLSPAEEDTSLPTSPLSASSSTSPVEGTTSRRMRSTTVVGSISPTHISPPSKLVAKHSRTPPVPPLPERTQYFKAPPPQEADDGSGSDISLNSALNMSRSGIPKPTASAGNTASRRARKLTLETPHTPSSSGSSKLANSFAGFASIHPGAGGPPMVATPTPRKLNKPVGLTLAEARGKDASSSSSPAKLLLSPSRPAQAVESPKRKDSKPSK